MVINDAGDNHDGEDGDYAYWYQGSDDDGGDDER
jgi:hypothetical protein